MRPQRLLDRPEAIDVIYATPEGMPRRFMWRRAAHDIARVEGPERIAPEWWRQPSSSRLRDYYRVEDSEGRRDWIPAFPTWFERYMFADVAPVSPASTGQAMRSAARLRELRGAR